MSAVPTTAAPAAVRVSLRALARRLALPVVFAASCVFQFVQARGHAAPTVFNDELLYAKLSQAIAAGHGLAIRGEHYGFPAPVASLLQAPAWLFGSMTEGYAAAKLLNALVMSAAVFPAYWLAGRYVRRSFALVGVGAVAHWVLTNASLLPFSLGLAVVPGALLGIGYALVRPRSQAERSLATVTVVATTLFIGQAALISAGEAHRPLERYLFYVTPLVFLAFFLYVEHGAPGRLAYTLATCIGAVGLSLVSLPGLTGTAAFFFDSVTLSGFAPAAYRLGLANASLLYSLVPLALGALALM